MRVNVDTIAIVDPRFKRLGRSLLIDWREALGRSLVVWHCCYEQRSPELRIEDVDLIAERDGFGAAMLAADLAEAMADANGNAPTIRIRGVADRIRFLEEQKIRGRKGGLKRARNQTLEQTPSERLSGACATLKPSLSLDLDLSPDLSLSQTRESVELAPPVTAPSQSAPRRARKTKAAETPAEAVCIGTVLQKLADRTGRAYGGDKTHRALVLRLLRDGYSVWDMRRVIAYCGDRLGWDGDPKMDRYMSPPTLFGPDNFAKRIGDARLFIPDADPDAPGSVDPKTGRPYE